MLLNEAGFSILQNGAPPKEALEVVQFCNKLPLAIGIAGALLKNMSLDSTGDWSGVLTVLKEEFGEGGTVRVFRLKFTLEDAIGSHACSLDANTRVTNGIPL
jgi:hypothetical protein